MCREKYRIHWRNWVEGTPIVEAKTKKKCFQLVFLFIFNHTNSNELLMIPSLYCVVMSPTRKPEHRMVLCIVYYTSEYGMSSIWKPVHMDGTVYCVLYLWVWDEFYKKASTLGWYCVLCTIPLSMGWAL